MVTGLILILLVSLSDWSVGVSNKCPSTCSCQQGTRHGHPFKRIRCSVSVMPDLSSLANDPLVKELTLDSYRNGNSIVITRRDFQSGMRINSFVVKVGSSSKLHDSAFVNLNDFLVTLRVGNGVVFNSTLHFLRGLTNLRRLELKNNKQYWTRSNDSQVVSLFSNLGLSNLRHLDLSYCFIYRMSYDVFLGVENISSLDLSGNRLNQIPYAVHRLRRLEYLDLSFNDIKSLIGGFFKKLGHLKGLRLAGNEFGELEIDTFNGLENSLTSLDLQMTKQKVIPTHALKKLKNLKHLNISENPFKLMPAHALKGEYCLHRLDMHDLDIVFHPTMFQGQTNCLRVLSVYKPKLDYIPREAFASLRRLELLEFQAASVKVLRRNSLAGIKAKTIDLSFLPLTSVEHGAFNNLSFPINVVMRGTYLTNLNFAMNCPSGTFKSLEVEGSLMCDCSIAPALQKLACVISGSCTRTDNSENLILGTAKLRKYLQCPRKLATVSCCSNSISLCHKLVTVIFIVSVLRFYNI